MAWDVEYTDEFEAWWDSLSEAEQDATDRVVLLLLERGPQLGYPFSSDLRGSHHPHLRELRVQHAGRPIRILYAFIHGG